MKQAHIAILKSFDDLKFNLGKRTLLDYMKGDLNPTIEKNNLEELDSYGSLFMLDKGDILNLIDQLIKEGYLQLSTITGGFQVVTRTSKGIKEIYERKFEPKENESSVNYTMKTNFKISSVTPEDRKLFAQFDFFLNKYNDEQKKVIMSSSNNILCIAGAGSGKTTVLTKRIEFLKKFKSVKEEKILAITFTRKAKEEMQHRLEELGILNVYVETFNSFCEKILKKYGDKIYTNDVKVASFGDKISIVRKAIDKLQVSFEVFFEDYFNKRQVREKSQDELFFIFVNDIFTVIDYYKNLELEIKPFYEKESNLSKKRVAKYVYEIAKFSEEELKRKNLRDFSDQITDTIKLFRENRNLIPKFEYVLVDEYQDVNLVQYELLKLFDSPNIFAVGDPRQGIYGWRGSDVNFILDFPKQFKDTQVISLKKNYRSQKQIVDFANLAIKAMNLTDLESNYEEDKEVVSRVSLVEQDSEILEKKFILESIKNSKVPRNEIFILARTNRILDNYTDFLAQNGVKYTIKSEEEYRNGEPKEDEVVLATIHSIKGMEAKEVYLVGCNSLSFPNKVQDNFVFSLIKEGDDYDKQAEELRLFYVAITRAKEKLVITYTGNYSKFITNDMLNLLVFKEKNKKLFEFGSDIKSNKLDSSNSTILKNMLKNWRNEKANQLALQTYMIISNQAIEDLVKLRPSTKVELLNVNGLGEMKIAKYGDEILKIING